MKKLFYYFAFALLLSFFTTNIFAQNIEKQILSNNGSPKYIKFNEQLKLAATSADQVLKTYVFNKAGDDIKLAKTETDKIGESHQDFQQYFKGV
jgi:Zn-dependent metalloprotease